MLTQIVMGAVVLLAIMALMSVGVLFGRKPIQGSCGGIGAALNDDNYECEFCGGDADKCETLTAAEQGRAGRNELAYEATRDAEEGR